MIWHIFRKDLRLLWPMAALVAGVQWLNAGLLIGGGLFARSALGQSEYGWVSNNLLPGIALLGLAVLVMAVIQQDRLAGTTQDWLTRPIPRSRLLVAKLLFIGLTGLLPILIADVAMGLAEHLNPAEVVLASLTRSVVLLWLVCLPAALIGAVTRTLTEALVLVLAVVVLLVIEFITLVQFGKPMPIMQSGYGWIVAPILGVLNLAALTILLPLQFRWRSTNRVRWILAAYFCLLPAIAFIPWNAAFQIDRAFESDNIVPPVGITPDANRRITFTPTASYAGTPGKPASVVLKVPVVLSNLGPGNRLYLDRIKLHAAGRRELEDPFGYLSDGSSDPGKPAAEIVMTLPFEAFNAARGAQSQIHMRLLATKLRLTAEKPLHSLTAGSIDDHGRCYRQEFIRGDRTFAMINCVSTRPIGSCFRIKDPARRVPNALTASLRCGGSSYAPWPLPLWRDAYYTVSLGTVDDPRQLKSNPIISNYVPDLHIALAIDFAVAAAIETTGVKSADGAGPAARFAAPAAMVADRRGNLFIVDEADSVIRKITAAGEVNTFAGVAQQTGRNDGAGAEARFTNPRGIAIDAADNLLVADSGNGLIRRITPAGVVSTMMGTAGGNGNRMVALRFNNPRGVVWAADGTVYVLDSNANDNPRVRKVTPAGVVSTVAGPDQPAGGPDDEGIVSGMPREMVLQRD